jgi:hypothetical protein
MLPGSGEQGGRRPAGAQKHHLLRTLWSKLACTTPGLTPPDADGTGQIRPSSWTGGIALTQPTSHTRPTGPAPVHSADQYYRWLARVPPLHRAVFPLPRSTRPLTSTRLELVSTLRPDTVTSTLSPQTSPGPGLSPNGSPLPRLKPKFCSSRKITWRVLNTLMNIGLQGPCRLKSTKQDTQVGLAKPSPLVKEALVAEWGSFGLSTPRPLYPSNSSLDALHQ